jgi:hypothetical protein
MRRVFPPNIGPALLIMGGFLFTVTATAMLFGAADPANPKVIEAQVIRLKSPNGKFSVVMQAADDQAFVSLKGEDGRVAVVFVSAKDRGLVVHGDKGVKEIHLGTEGAGQPGLIVYDNAKAATTPKPAASSINPKYQNENGTYKVRRNFEPD